jgi:uncharacterized protein YecE (DUF72 family)
MELKVGTAGWTIPRAIAHEFPSEGAGLERYSARFPVVEINSSFHRSHRRSTWERWCNSVPTEFRFSVKVPKLITHVAKLTDCSDLVDEFLAEAGILSEKLGLLLVQLPPKLAFDKAVATDFLISLTDRTDVRVVCEPRHKSWFAPEVDELLEKLRIARVAADPAICDAAARPGPWGPLSYWRLHGSPVIYRSSYLDRIATYAETLRQQALDGREVWCIFDNTASSAGAIDALALNEATSAMEA